MILYLGGGIGNLIDRLTQGYVTDFVSLGNFPVFNVADASISIGVVILALGVFLKEQEEKKLTKAQSTDFLIWRKIRSIRIPIRLQ